MSKPMTLKQFPGPSIRRTTPVWSIFSALVSARIQFARVPPIGTFTAWLKCQHLHAIAATTFTRWLAPRFRTPGRPSPLVPCHVPFFRFPQRRTAKEVQRQTGVTYKTAWRMCNLIRQYMGWVDGDAPLGGKGTFVETDKAFIGGKDKAGHDDKAIVLGMVERGGEIITRIVPDRTQKRSFPKFSARTCWHHDLYG